MRAWLVVMVCAAFIAWPSPAAAQASPFALNDPTGDVSYVVFGESAEPPAAVPPNPDTGAVDLVALMVGDEDLTAFRVVLEVAESYSPANAADWTYYRHGVAFQVEGVPVVYELEAWFSIPHFLELDGSRVEPATQSGLCLTAGDPAPGAGACYAQRADAHWDFATDRIVWQVPKLGLVGAAPPADGTGATPRPGGVPDHVPAGAELTGFHVRSAQNRAFFTINGSGVGWTDGLPNDGPSSERYPLAFPTANDRIRATLDGWQDAGTAAPRLAAVTPGGKTTIDIRVSNAQPAKRLVNLVAEAGPGTVADSLSLVPTLEVPGRDHRVIQLAVDVADDVAHGARQDVRLRGDAVGYADEVAILPLTLVVAAPLTPDGNRLHLHASDNRSWLVEADGQGFLCDPLEGCSGERRTWLSAQEDDPRANMDETGYAGAFPSLVVLAGGWQEWVRMEKPVPNDLWFDTDRPVQARLTFETGTAFDGTATLRLFSDPASGCPIAGCAERQFLGEGSVSTTFGSGRTAVDIPVTLLSDASVVKAPGRSLSYHLQIETDDHAATWANWADAMRVIPAESWIDLPLRPAPEADRPSNLSVRAAGSAQEFVNPGAARAFHVIVLNQAGHEQRVAVQAAAEPSGWSVRVEPADRYVLPPGGAVNVTVLAKAPAGAAEGDRATVKVSAHAVDDPARRATTRLVAVVTDGVALADDAEAYTVDAEAAERAERPEEADAPGLGAVVAALAVLAALAANRPRRKGL